MKPIRLAPLAAAAILGIAFAGAALAQPQTREDCERLVKYKPSSGQPGKDVVWVPTPDEFVEKMLRMAGVGKSDYVIDLGAGDGKIAIAAARQFGARSLGIEYNSDMVKIAECMVQAEGVAGRASVIEGDIFKFDFSQADVLTLYLLPQLNLCVRHRILAMRPGVRVATHQYHMGDWGPDESATSGDFYVYLWLVPARVAGTWAFRERGGARQQFTVSLSQAYQQIGGEVSLGGERRQLVGASLRGNEIRFSFNDDKDALRTFTGHVNGTQITGELASASGALRSMGGTLQGELRPAPWAEMDPSCGKSYGKQPAVTG